ncbi:MAG: ABC transporter permease subunit [Bifidobacteriaceae bacterium]|jgi:arabinogalactan oligomer/maltooligosaccharide transport system permease protein|nr:ABC transporter permease subunit [Bifidobacteriaceae bacterium]
MSASAPLAQLHRHTAGSRKRWWVEVGWRYIIGIVMVLIVGVPVLYIIGVSLDPSGSTTASSVFPSKITFDNYAALLGGDKGPFGRWYLNTLIVCLVVTVLQILCSALAAYAFSRLRFTGRRVGILALLLIMMFPNVLAIIALYSMFTQLGEAFPIFGLSTIAGYVLCLMGGALGQVWLVKGTLDSIPQSLDEAAIIDGASHFQVFSRILFPILIPIIATTAMLAFVGIISEFIIGSMFLKSADSMTLAVGLYGLLQGDKTGNYGVFAAGAVMVSVPVVVLFLFLQRYIVGGAVAGAVKG